MARLLADGPSMLHQSWCTLRKPSSCLAAISANMCREQGEVAMHLLSGQGTTPIALFAARPFPSALP